jgi:hypothetical protein
VHVLVVLTYDWSIAVCQPAEEPGPQLRSRRAGPRVVRARHERRVGEGNQTNLEQQNGIAGEAAIELAATWTLPRRH